MNNNSWTTPIDKLMQWRTSSWIKYEAKLSNLLLRIHYDQMLITSGSKVLESFNLHHKIKGIYKDDVIILIVSNDNKEIRKLKFQLKSNAVQCFQKLGEHFPVVSHNNVQANRTITSKYRIVDDVLKHGLNKRDNRVIMNLPSDWNNFIKLCLLDPMFPQLVHETEKILENEFFKK